MAIRIHAPFEPSEIGNLTGTLQETGHAPVTWTISGTAYFPCMSATIGRTSYEDFGGLLTRVLTTASDPGENKEYIVRYDNQTGKYFIWGNNASFTASFNPVAQRVLGLTGSSFRVSNLSFSSSVTPHYTWNASEGGRSKYTDEFEPEPIYVQRFADDGTPYSIGRLSSSIRVDWVFPNEPQSAVFRHSSGSAAPWTYQDFISYVRSSKPWILIETGSAVVNYNQREATYFLTAEGSTFGPKQLFDDYVSHWNAPIQALKVSKP